MSEFRYPTDEELFCHLVPQPDGEEFAKNYARRVNTAKYEVVSEYNKALKAFTESTQQSDPLRESKLLEAFGRIPLAFYRVMEPWIEDKLKNGTVDSYPSENRESLIQIETPKVHGASTWGQFRALDGVSYTVKNADPNTHLGRMLHLLERAVHPVTLGTLCKELLELIPRVLLCGIPLAAGVGLFWWITRQTSHVEGFIVIALGLVILGIFLMGTQIIGSLAEPLADYRRRKQYRREGDATAQDTYRLVRFFELWAQHIEKTLDVERAHQILDEYAAYRNRGKVQPLSQEQDSHPSEEKSDFEL